MTELGGPWASEDAWWIRDNLRETIDRLVELGYEVRGGEGEEAGEDTQGRHARV